MRGLRTCIFFGELDGIIPGATDIGNAHLDAVASENVCIRAGPEFGELEGHLFIIYKALYGLCLSGVIWTVTTRMSTRACFQTFICRVNHIYAKISNN